MPFSWKILHTAPADAEANMSFDAQLLDHLSKEQQLILHFYDWQGDCATYGHFIRPDALLNMEGILKRGVQLAKRPTGGGILFHLRDLTFSVLVPSSHPGFSNTLNNYAWVNNRIIQAIRLFRGEKQLPTLLPLEKAPMDEFSKHFCMAKPTIYDVMIEGRKVCGGAQRRTKHGFLHQGTIALFAPDKVFLQDVLKTGTPVCESMHRHTYPLLDQPFSIKLLEEARKELRENLAKAFIKN